MTNKILQEYSDRGFSVIPIPKNSKISVDFWRRNQFQRACDLDVLSWTRQGFNLGIVTGQLSRLVVFDVDNLGSLQELQRQIPEIEQTATVKTASGKFHYYFESDLLIRTVKGSYLGIPDVERIAEGAYAVCPESIIDDRAYRFIRPLAEILPYPPRLIEESTAQRLYPQNLPYHHIDGRSCISQIEQKELMPGERNNSLHMLYRLLIKARNTSKHAREIVWIKNQSLRYPKSQKELRKVWKKDYRINCQGVRSCLDFVNCDDCRYNEREEKMFSLRVRNQSKLLTLTTTERSAIPLIDSFLDGKIPTASQYSKRFNVDWRTSKKIINGLKNKGIV
ncbi:hypothetical protein ES702_03809 [subsurface metagenome]